MSVLDKSTTMLLRVVLVVVAVAAVVITLTVVRSHQEPEPQRSSLAEIVMEGETTNPAEPSFTFTARDPRFAAYRSSMETAMKGTMWLTMDDDVYVAIVQLTCDGRTQGLSHGAIEQEIQEASDTEIDYWKMVVEADRQVCAQERE